MERLDAAAEHLRNLDRGRIEAELAEEGLGRAAGRDELDTEVGQLSCEDLEAAPVVDGDQRSHSSLTTFGSRRCSAA